MQGFMRPLIGGCAACLWGVTALAADGAPREPPQAALLRDVGFDQRLDEQAPVDLTFRDEQGRSVTLAECMSDRPTVLVLAYYRCPMLCNQVLNGVARAVQAIEFEPGEEFEVVVVSFDPSDTVELAAAKKEAVVHAFDHDADGRGWHFLVSERSSGEPQATTSAPAPSEPAMDPNVERLAESVGFRYRYQPEDNQFAHASGIVVLTPEGRVSKYFYGIDYPTRDLRLGIIDASEERIGTPVDQLLLYCFHYDPLTGRYGLAIMRVVRAAGLLTVIGIGVFIGVSLRRERRGRQRLSAKPAG